METLGVTRRHHEWKLISIIPIKGCFGDRASNDIVSLSMIPDLT